MRTTETLAHPGDGNALRDVEEGWGPGDAVLGRFRLERLLGAGGFGAVWRATDERLHRPVAVKVIARSVTAGARARREALAAARLNHPGIVALYEEGEDDRALYLVSELVEGRTLADLEADGALSDRAVVRLGAGLCEALSHAHLNGVIHRDVKPQNVLVPRRGSGSPAKLADFGVAHLMGDAPLTRTGDVLGTLAYMAPEQASGRRPGAPADLYALALVLYEALAGVNPVRAGTPAGTARRVGRPLPPLRRLRRDLPEGLCGALDRALRPRPAERGTLDDLRSALEAATQQVDDHGGLLPLAGPRPHAAPEIPARLVAGLAGGGLAAAALSLAGPTPPVPVALGAVGAGALVALLPRLGWLVCAVAVVAWVGGSLTGEAVLLAAALAAPPVLLARRGAWWSLPALAPLLALGSLAPAYCALAAQAPGPRARAALSAAGFWWLAIAEALLGRDLHLGRVVGAPAGARSAADAADVLWGVLSSGLVAGAVLWALAATLLPLLTARGGLLAATVGAAAWAAALVLATGALGRALEGAVALPDPRGTLAGAVAGAALAVASRALRDGPATARTP